MTRRLGPRYGMVNPIVGTVFPNFSFIRSTSRTFRVWHPRGPESIEVWSWGYVDKEAPPEVKDKVRLSVIQGFSPSGTFEQDDMDNWAGVHPDLPGLNVAPFGSEHADGVGPRPVQRIAGCHGERPPRQRIQPPKLLPPLGRVDVRTCVIVTAFRFGWSARRRR